MPVFVLYNEFKVMYDASNIQFKGFECFWLGGPDVIYSERKHSKNRESTQREQMTRHF